MLKINTALAAVLFALALPAAASAQGCGAQNPNCIVPTAPHGTSTNQAASTAFVRQEIGQAAGGTNGQVQYNNNGAFGGFTAAGDATIATPSGTVTIQPNAVTNGKINPGAANTTKGSLNGTTTSDIALTACTLSYQITKWVSGTGWQCGINPVLPSRAVAATLDLSAFDAVTTQGYARPGDGGGADFYKRNGAIITYSITNAGACNNGTWPGIRLTGGTGLGASGTLTVAGGIATNFSLHGASAQGVRYAVNDVLTVSNAGNVVCSTFPTITVNSVGNAPFIDSAVTAVSINAAGSGCTNGTYFGVTPQETVINGGGYGDRLQGNATIAGGVLTGFTISTPGGGYRVGDLLNFVNPNTSVQIPGCATQPVIQITATATPRASFTDTGSANNWQIVAGANNNVLQFGAVADYFWLYPDGDATDNGPAFAAAIAFTSVGNGPADAHGYGGGSLYVPKGGYLVCGGIIQYQYVTLRGAGFGASNLKQCNTDGATASLITQGDPLSRIGNFFAQTWDLTLYGSTTGTGPLIYSNNNQSGDAISRVAMYPNTANRTCVKYEIGWGGQSMYGMHSVLCVPQSGSPAFDLSGNFGFVIDGETQVSPVVAIAIAVRFGDGGTAYVGPGFHCEGTTTDCISVNGSGSSPPLVTVVGAVGPATHLVRVETGSPANNVTVINTASNGSTCVVFMQATATCAKAGSQLGLATY